MKGALNEKTFGAIKAPAEELDHVLAHQERRKCAPRAEYGRALRQPVAAQYLIEIRLPEHRVLELARVAGPARQCRPFKTVHLSDYLANPVEQSPGWTRLRQDLSSVTPASDSAAYHR